MELRKMRKIAAGRASEGRGGADGRGETEFAEVGELVAKEFLIDPPADEE